MTPFLPADKSPAPTLTLTASPLPTEPPLPTGTGTPTASPVPCDPAAGYCIATGHFFFDRPIALPGVITVDPTYTYGTTQQGARDPHHGVEFYNASGTPVLAAADGIAVVAGNDSQTIYGLYPNSYGNLIILEHHFPGIEPPVYSVYGHLSRVEVQVGQAVHAGEEIGLVGSSGAAIGSHLHFEVRLGQNNYDSNRNPILWLKPLIDDSDTQYGVIAGRLVDAAGNLIYTRNLSIQYFLDPAGRQLAQYPIETYAPEQHPVRADDAWQENFALGELEPGHYRISLIRKGRLYERWVAVNPGRVTVVTFTIK